MSLARSWMRQANSDWHAANRMLDRSDSTTYCHCIAKLQQASEKSVKAISAALDEAGISGTSTGRRHIPEKLLNALILLPNRHGDIVRNIKVVLSEFIRSEVVALCRLAPKWPEPGQLFQRNTEYPFNTDPGNWRAPADIGAFSVDEIERYCRLVDKLLPKVNRIVDAALVGPK